MVWTRIIRSMLSFLLVGRGLEWSPVLFLLLPIEYRPVTP